LGLAADGVTASSVRVSPSTGTVLLRVSTLAIAIVPTTKPEANSALNIFRDFMSSSFSFDPGVLITQSVLGSDSRATRSHLLTRGRSKKWLIKRRGAKNAKKRYDGSGPALRAMEFTLDSPLNVHGGKIPGSRPQ